MNRIEQIQAEIGQYINKEPISFENAIKFLEYWRDNVAPNVPNINSEESEKRAIDFWGTENLKRITALDVGIFPDVFVPIFVQLSMRKRVVEWKADNNAQLMFNERKQKHEKYLAANRPQEHKKKYLEERIAQIDGAIEIINDNEITSYAGGKYVQQLVLFNYEKPYLLKMLKDVEQFKIVSFKEHLLQDVSADNDFDFYFNLDTKIMVKGFFAQIEEYFQTGRRRGFIEPLAFMNLLWAQLEYFKNNVDRPYSVVQYYEALPLTAEQKHVLYGFILKFYGGYPTVFFEGIQTAIALLLIEEAFLSYEGDTPEKEYCRRRGFDSKENSKYISFDPAPKTYRYTENDFAGFLANNDWDFYHNLENIPNQSKLVFQIKKYFQTGERAGFIEPLAFMNLVWKQNEYLKNNLDKPSTVVTTMKGLPFDNEVKHALFGMLLYFRGDYPFGKEYFGNDDKQRTILLRIEKEFLSYEGDTPEKWLFSKDWIKEERLNEPKKKIELQVVEPIETPLPQSIVNGYDRLTVEVQNIIIENLKHLNGERKTERIMQPKDYERLLRYVYDMVDKNEVPTNTNPININNNVISQKFLIKTFGNLHKTLKSKITIDRLKWSLFLKGTFSLFLDKWESTSIDKNLTSTMDADAYNIFMQSITKY